MSLTFLRIEKVEVYRRGGHAVEMEMQFNDQLFNQTTLSLSIESRQCNFLININSFGDDKHSPTNTDVELCWGPYGHSA